MPKQFFNNVLGLAALAVFTLIAIALFSSRTQPTATSPVVTPTMATSSAVPLAESPEPSATPLPPVLAPTPQPTLFDPASGMPSLIFQTERLLPSEFDGYRPAIAPDGQRVAYAAERDGQAGIFVINLMTQAEMRLTTDMFRNLEASWSPDGTRIAYEHVVTSPADSTSTLERIVINADGTGKQVVSSGVPWSAGSEAPAWSPDGTRLAFTDNTDIVVVNVADGREVGRFGPADVLIHTQPAWLDSEHVVFVGEKMVQVVNLATNTSEKLVNTSGAIQALVTGSGLVYLQQDGSTIRVIRLDPAGLPASTLGVFQSTLVGNATASPDGRFVAVETPQGLYVVTEKWATSGSDQPYLLLKTADVPQYLREAAWLPDSSGFIFVGVMDGRPVLELAWRIVEDNMSVPTPAILWANRPAPTPTATVRPDPHMNFNSLEIVAVPPGGAYLPEVSPDGRSVSYTSVRDGNWDIYRLDFATLYETRLTGDARTETTAAWSPDGSRIAYRRYASEEAAPGSVEWVVMNADGSSPQVVARGISPREHELPVWSPSGEQLAFIDGVELVVVNVNEQRELRRFGTEGKPLTEQPVWLDNDQILFIRDGLPQRGRVTTGAVESIVGPTAPVAEVLVRNSGLVYIRPEGSQIYVVSQNLDGTDSVTLAAFTVADQAGQFAPIKNAALSPDGRYITIQTEHGLYVTYIGNGQMLNAGSPAELPQVKFLGDVLGSSWLRSGSGFVCVTSFDQQNASPILYMTQPQPGTEDPAYPRLILPTLTPTPTLPPITTTPTLALPPSTPTP